MAHSRPSVFLCHNSSDKAAVEWIAGALLERDVEPWLDRWNLIPGEPWVPALQEALGKCTAVAVFAGPSGRSPWQNKEMELALNQKTRVIPVLLPGAVSDVEPSFLSSYTRVEFGSSLDDEEAIRLLICGIKGEKPGPRTSSLTAARLAGCPYRGLTAFDVADGQLFFGRENETQDLLQRIDALASSAGPRLLGIIGDSGSGKSSLARAGLLCALTNGAVKDRTFLPVVLTPGRDPVMALASALGDMLPTRPDATKLLEYGDAIRRDKRMLHLQARGAIGSEPHKTVVVLADQFEEVFSCESAQDRIAFVENLMYAASHPSPSVFVVVTVRADYYGDCSDPPELGACLSKNHLLLGAMRREALRAAIEEPARLAGRRVEPQLTVALLDEASQADCLPLLQFILQKLWEDSGRVLSLHDYEKKGCLGGALNQHAEELFGTFDDAGRSNARTIMLRLVQPVRDGRYIRTRIPYTELLPPATDARAVKAVEEVAGKLAYPGRLLTFSSRGAEGRFVELAHDALIQSWTRLRAWLGEDEEFLLWRQRLRVAMEDCRRFKRHRTTLLAGVRLEEALRRQKERRQDLNDEEHAYIDESRRARRRSQLISGAQVALASVALLLTFGWYQYRDIVVRSQDAVARRSPESVVLALRAFEWFRSAENKALLEEAVQFTGRPLIEHGDAQPVRDLTFSSDARYIATAAGTRARLCGPGAAGCTKTLDLNSDVLSVAINPAASHLAVGTGTGLSIWPFPEDAALVESATPSVTIAFSPDGKTIAAGSVDGKVRLVNAITGKETRLLTGHNAPITTISFSPDGSWVAAGASNGRAVLWPLQGGDPVQIEHEEVPLVTAAFVDSARIFTASLLGSAYIWSVPDRRQLARTDSAITVAGAAAGGQRIAISTETRLLICAPETLRPLLTIPLSKPREHRIAKIAVAPNGERVAVADSAGNAYVYEMVDQKLIEAARLRSAELKMN